MFSIQSIQPMITNDKQALNGCISLINVSHSGLESINTGSEPFSIVALLEVLSSNIIIQFVQMFAVKKTKHIYSNRHTYMIYYLFTA